MKITDLKIYLLDVPLRTPFITALRRVDQLTDVILELHTDTGNVGYGEAPPTKAITGETLHAWNIIPVPKPVLILLCMISMVS